MDAHFFRWILHYVSFVCIVSYSPFECHKTVRHENGTVENKRYCCNNAQMRDEICEECNIGYKSDSGGPCLPCSNNRYGTKCALRCKCPEWQSCHHIRGCINIPTTTAYTDLKDNKTAGVVSQKSTINVKRMATSDITRKDGPITNGDAEQNTVVITRITNKDTDSLITSERGEQNKGDTSNIVVYSACIGGLLLVITFCYACLRFLRNRGITKSQNITEPQEPNQNVLNTGGTGLAITTESIYDEIDDSSFPNQFQFQQQNNEIVGNTGNKYLTLVADTGKDSTSDNSKSNRNSMSGNCDYLNPYQPIVEDPDVHKYTTKASIPLKNLDETSLPDNKSSQKLRRNSSEKSDNESDPGHNDYLDPVFSLGNLNTSDRNISASENALNSMQYSEIIGTLHPIGSDAHIDRILDAHIDRISDAHIERTEISVSSECVDICHEVKTMSCSNELDGQNSHAKSEILSSQNNPLICEKTNDMAVSTEMHETNAVAYSQNSFYLKIENSCEEIADTRDTIESTSYGQSQTSFRTECQVEGHQIQYAELATKSDEDPTVKISMHIEA